MPRWRKLHTKVRESFDVNEMPDDFTRLLWLLLQLAADREGRGIDSPSWIKAQIMPLREDVSDGMIDDAMAWLAQPERKMVRRYKVADRPYFLIVNFKEYQGDTSREAESYFPAPPLGGEEVTSSAEATQEAITSESRVTQEGLTSEPGVTQEPVMSKSSSDADADATEKTLAPQGAKDGPKPVKSEKRRARRRTADARTGHVAIQCVRRILGGRRYPPLELYDRIIGVLGETPDEGLLRRCRERWVENGYNRQGWAWLTEWYAAGGPKGNGRGARASPRQASGEAQGETDWMAASEEERELRGSKG